MRGCRYSVDFVRKAPAEISLIAGDAIHNLSNALDHLALKLFLVGPACGDRSQIAHFTFRLPIVHED